MIYPGFQCYTNLFNCPTCSLPVVNRMPQISRFIQYVCSNPSCPDVNAVVVVEKETMTVLTVQHPSTPPPPVSPVPGA